MTLSLDALRLERPDTRVTTGPFTVVEVDNYLPSALYGELLGTYPDPAKDGRKHSMKNYLNSGTAAFDAFMAEHEPWSNLVRYMDSDEFVGHIYDYCRPLIHAARGPLGSRPWSRRGVPIAGGAPAGVSALSKLANRLKFIEIETEFQLSSMEHGHCITPHSDAQYKLVSILVYFPFADWQSEWGGGTQFFRPRTRDGERRWCVPEVNHVKHYGQEGLDMFARDMECFHTAAFGPNRLAIFCKSNYTFHAVDRISCPPDRRRNALVMNINAKEPQEAWLRKAGQVARMLGRVRNGSAGRPPLRPQVSESYD
jgi:hypothetical protein